MNIYPIGAEYMNTVAEHLVIMNIKLLHDLNTSLTSCSTLESLWGTLLVASVDSDNSDRTTKLTGSSASAQHKLIVCHHFQRLFDPAGARQAKDKLLKYFGVFCGVAVQSKPVGEVVAGLECLTRNWSHS